MQDGYSGTFLMAYQVAGETLHEWLRQLKHCAYIKVFRHSISIDNADTLC